VAGGQPAVTVKGGPQLQRAFGRMADRADDMRSAHDAAAGVVADRARDLAPRQSGALADSIHVETSDTGAVVAVGGPSIPYAGPIHFGWRDRNIEPQPFMTDALADAGPDVREAYDDGVGDVVKRFDREAP